MKINGQLHASADLFLGEGETLWYPFDMSLVRTKVGLDAVVRRKISTPTRN
jgi:hypothetical protein